MAKVEIKKEELKKKGGKTLGEFKEFITKGNVMDMAVGVMMGSAFGKIVTSIVEDILTPIIGAINGGIDCTNLSVKIGEATIAYGKFIQNVINFFIIAICIFFMVKVIEKITKKNKKEEVVEEEPEKDANIVLLEEIRDLLKEKQNV